MTVGLRVHVLPNDDHEGVPSLQCYGLLWQSLSECCFHRSEETVPAVKEEPLPGFHQQHSNDLASARLICCAAMWGLQTALAGTAAPSVNGVNWKKKSLHGWNTWNKHSSAYNMDILQCGSSVADPSGRLCARHKCTCRAVRGGDLSEIRQ